MTLQSLFTHPIIQGPMAGGAATPALAAVSNAGALGSLAGSLLASDTLRAQVAQQRQLTDQPLLLNVFVHAGGEMGGGPGR